MKNYYYVIATRWDDEVRAQVKYIAGEFDSFVNAKIFRDAYNAHYSANAYIEDKYTLLNNKE